MPMNTEELRDFCLSLKGTTEGFPFDEVTLVFKVANKMYMLMSLDVPLSINLKCEPGLAVQLRERYPAVAPGYHMNKKHWNTVEVDGSIPSQTIMEWIQHSYSLVISTLPKYLQKDLL